MESNFKISKNEHIYKPLDIFNDKVTKSKIYRHLVDINDIISEDDIRNIRVAIPEGANKHFNNEEDNHKNISITPWDILDVEVK